MQRFEVLVELMGMRHFGSPGEPRVVTTDLLRLAMLNKPFRADPDDCV